MSIFKVYNCYICSNNLVMQLSLLGKLQKISTSKLTFTEWYLKFSEVQPVFL